MKVITRIFLITLATILVSTAAHSEQNQDLPGVEMTETSIEQFWETEAWKGTTKVYGQASRASTEKGFSPADPESSLILSEHMDEAFTDAGFSYAKTLENYTRWALGLEGAYGDDEIPQNLFSASGVAFSITTMKRAMQAGVHFDLVDKGVFTPEQAKFLWMHWREGKAADN